MVVRHVVTHASEVVGVMISVFAGWAAMRLTQSLLCRSTARPLPPDRQPAVAEQSGSSLAAADTPRSQTRVKELWVFPIKGARGFRVSSWRLAATGLWLDREWAVLYRTAASSAWCVASSNKFPALAAVETHLTQSTLTITCGNAALFSPRNPETSAGRKAAVPEPLCISLDASHWEEQPMHSIELFGMAGVAQEQGTAANQWWSNVLGADVRFVRMMRSRRPLDSKNHLGCDARPADAIAFHDYATLHLISSEGLQWLRETIPEAHRLPEHPITSEQFRANVVVEGTTFPEEDTWAVIRVGGNTTMRVAKQSGRCVIPTHNASGVRHPNFEPTATLRKHRSAFHRHQQHRSNKQHMFMFGLDLLHNIGGETDVTPTFPQENSVAGLDVVLQVGDPVEVLRFQDAPLYHPAS